MLTFFLTELLLPPTDAAQSFTRGTYTHLILVVYFFAGGHLILVDYMLICALYIVLLTESCLSNSNAPLDAGISLLYLIKW